MRICVFGPGYEDYIRLRFKLDRITSELDLAQTTILSGHEDGAGNLAELWAFERMVPYQVWRPTEFNGDMVKRNKAMLDNADCLVVFPIGESKAIDFMLKEAKKRKLKTRVIKEK